MSNFSILHREATVSNFSILHQGGALRAPRGPVPACSRKRSRGTCGLPAGPRAARGAKQPAVAAAVATKPWILGCTWPTATFSAVAVLIGPTIVDKTNIDQIARFASAGAC